jgi:hypothetical protein
MPKRRIIRSDAYNWSIQEWQSGGDVIERGRFAGQAKQSKWRNPEKHYPTLADAAKAYLDEAIGDPIPMGEGIAVEAMIVAIEGACQQVKDHVTSLLQSQKDDFLIGILQQRGYTVTSGKKGRSSYVEDESSDTGADSDSSPVAS